MLLFFIGVISGIVSGMGIGGGAILIPALVLFARPEQHIAQSINLLFFIPTAIVALFIHIKNKQINFKTAIPIIIAGFIGAYIGSKFAIATDGKALKVWFGVFLLIMGVYEFFRKDSKDKAAMGKEPPKT